ncbi:hypothetical protein A8F94_11970 [Bacillus sp. FJAT-27225]|uniref:DUF3055 domain-containing protein n=1 Tax=Bacillus sp. FJAT-27225 TaxID=1743144 RepID=UPI00080C25B7|nr:DUF3055 domain-containing protein [Bacillus sp. FJAT-27225]OCA85595.1 hypothetical protein A8F94_11970 [Bacillus sp. FJAT-27225]
MDFFEKLYDEHENVKVRFTGFATENARYDFGIVYSSLFFGKPLVVCMQTGQSVLLDPNDLNDLNYLQQVFRINGQGQAEDLAEFLTEILPAVPFQPQYE